MIKKITLHEFLANDLNNLLNADCALEINFKVTNVNPNNIDSLIDEYGDYYIDEIRPTVIDHSFDSNLVMATANFAIELGFLIVLFSPDEEDEEKQ